MGTKDAGQASGDTRHESRAAQAGRTRLTDGARYWYDYALLRAVPRVERGECVNVGVVLFCREFRFLGARVRLRGEPLRLIDPEIDLEALDRALRQVVAIADGDLSGGPVAELPRPERFHWLTAPRSTVLQPSAVHTGRTHAPADTLAELFEEMVG